MLKPDAAIMSGLAVAGVVFAVHAKYTPTLADMQGLPAGTKDVDKSERQATIISVGIVSGISLLAKDPTIFVIGSVATVALAFTSRHALWTDSKTGLLNAGPGQSAVSANDLSTGPSMSTQDVHMYADSSQYT
jgi:hypothetical protein